VQRKQHRASKTLAGQVAKKKLKKYGAAAENEGCELIVAAVSAQGELSAAFERLLLRFVPAGFHEARRAISAAAVAGSGRALLCAERTATGCKHALQDPDEEEDRVTRLSRFAAHFATPPDLWGELGSTFGEEETEEVRKRCGQFCGAQQLRSSRGCPRRRRRGGVAGVGFGPWSTFFDLIFFCCSVALL